MFCRLKEFSQDAKKLDEPWIRRKTKGTMDLIDLSSRKLYLLKVVNRMDFNFLNYLNNYNCFLKKKFFPVNRNLSSKMSYFIKHFKIHEKVDLKRQFAFAVIECRKGKPILIGPFKPKTVENTKKYPDKHHSEHQCISKLKQEIKYMKKKKRIIKTIYLFTKYSPCSGIKGDLCPCMTQLANFSQEMNNEFNIDIYITFEDIYGATGSIAQTINTLVKPEKKLNNDEKNCRNRILRLIKKVKQQYPKSKFKCFLGDKEQKDIKKDIIGDIAKIKPNIDIELKIKFPSNPSLLHEFKSFGEKLTNNIKTQLKNNNFTREITENICSLFHSKWCEAGDKEYSLFIYEKLSDYFNTFAVALVYKDIKAIISCFNLEKVQLHF